MGLWTATAALLGGSAALILFALTVLFIVTPDPNRPMLDEIDRVMILADWDRAETLCRQRLAELDHAPSDGAGPGPFWTRRIDPTTELQLRLGISLSMLERFDEARAMLDEALVRRPEDSRLAFNRALIEYRTNNLGEALAQLQDLADRAKHAPHVNFHIGRIYETWGQYDNALKAYRDELNISSSPGAWQRYMILKNMRGATLPRE